MTVFKENLTSKVLQDISLGILNEYKKIKNVLEIGCGDGNITNFLHKKSENKNIQFHCSDISEEATTKAKLKLLESCFIIKTGELFTPWLDQKFDLIVSDVSSLADDVAIRSEWYDGVICNSGKDGLKNINQIIGEVLNYLNQDGIFILPMISLSNLDKLKKLLSTKFNNITYSKKQYWPIPEFFKSNISIFTELKNLGIIDFDYKFGIYQAYTYAAICKK
jgi:methylase of polypeptide subunit release factors